MGVASAAEDWEDTIRRAFLDGCVAYAHRVDVTRGRLHGALGAEEQRTLVRELLDHHRRVGQEWEVIESALERFGTLAALALERCIEEASLEERRSMPPRPSSTRLRTDAPSSVVPLGDDREPTEVERIVARARLRLERFYM